MTNIQAINLLKNLEQCLDDYCELSNEGKTAFRMAITALELFGNAEQLPSAQPVIRTYMSSANDTISRQAAKDALAKFVPYAICDESTESYTNGLTDAYNLICQLPSAQPEQSSEIQDILEYLDTVLHPIISPDHWNVYSELHDMISMLPPAQSEITDGQAIEHLQSTGWMQNHDKQMYEMGLKEQLADDSGSYDSLIPSAQPDDWMERNKEHILQAGMEGREIEFRIGGRLFAIREKAQ